MAHAVGKVWEGAAIIEASSAAEARAALAAIGRLDDADTALSLAAEGSALYEREAVKLDGYAYCSQAVELAEKGEFREGLGELEAWALMGMNVFVGLRYVVWGGAEMSPDEVAAGVNRLLAEGVLRG